MASWWIEEPRVLSVLRAEVRPMSFDRPHQQPYNGPAMLHQRVRMAGFNWCSTRGQGDERQVALPAGSGAGGGMDRA